MRPIDRILNREPTPTPSYAVRPFGTTAAEAQAADAAAAENSNGTTTENLTTGTAKTPVIQGELINRGEKF
jgi:hypothetical protein